MLSVGQYSTYSTCCTLPPCPRTVRLLVVRWDWVGLRRSKEDLWWTMSNDMGTAYGHAEVLHARTITRRTTRYCASDNVGLHGTTQEHMIRTCVKPSTYMARAEAGSGQHRLQQDQPGDDERRFPR